MLLWLALVGAGLFALSKSGVTIPTSPVSTVPITGTNATQLGGPQPVAVAQGAVPQPSVPWPPSNGSPGWVTVGGQPVSGQYYAGSIDEAQKAIGLTSVAVGTFGGIAQGITAITGNAILPSVGAFLPVIGAGIAAVGIVLSIISKHHQAAVAKEAQTLDQTIPVARQRQVLICQAAIRGEINYTQAVALVQQLISDAEKMMSVVQKGSWKWNPSFNDSSAGFKVGAHSNTWGMNQSSPNAHAPSVCNSACWYSHFIVEIGRAHV